MIFRIWMCNLCMALALALSSSTMPLHAEKGTGQNLLTSTFNAFQTPWISAPQTDSTSMLWFTRIYKQTSRPRKAFVSVATTGKIQLLVNGMNVSRNLYEPFRSYADTTEVNIRYDITPFLARNNTISLWYCPTMPHAGRKQVAISYWGELADGTPFAYNSDETWACRRANRGMQWASAYQQNPSSHQQDVSSDRQVSSSGQQYPSSGMLFPLAEWHNATDNATPWQINLADSIPWLSASRYNAIHVAPLAQPLQLIPAPRVIRVFSPEVQNTKSDTLIYRFPRHFQGIVRITFRGTRRGENIYINHLRYICNGATDEQAFSKFTLTDNFNLIIHGDKYFRLKSVQNVEALETRIVLYRKFLF